MLLDTIPDIDMTGRQRQPVAGEVPNPIDPPPGCPFNPRCAFANDRCRTEVPVAKSSSKHSSPASGRLGATGRPGPRLVK